MNWKRKTSMIPLFLVALLLSACSYREFEDSLKNQLNSEDEEETINTVKLSEYTSNNGEDSILSVGDTISFTDAGNETVQYTLNKVSISNNINDVGLEKANFSDRALIKDNGDIDKEHQLVTLDVTIKNIDYKGTDFDEDQNQALLFIEPSVGYKESIEDPNGPFLLYAAYFSEHAPLDQNHGQDYYSFMLGIGEEVDATVGWFVPTDLLEEDPLYYIIGYAGMPEDFRFFQLTMNEGDVSHGD